MKSSKLVRKPVLQQIKKRAIINIWSDSSWKDFEHNILSIPALVVLKVEMKWTNFVHSSIRRFFDLLRSNWDRKLKGWKITSLKGKKARKDPESHINPVQSGKNIWKAAKILWNISKKRYKKTIDRTSYTRLTQDILQFITNALETERRSHTKTNLRPPLFAKWQDIHLTIGRKGVKSRRWVNENLNSK